MYSIEMAQFRGYIEVQKGSLHIQAESSGLFVAVSCPKRAVSDLSQDPTKLSLAKHYLSRVQT